MYLKLKKTAQKLLHSWLYQQTRSRAFFTIWGLAIQEFRVAFAQFFTWKSPIRSFLRVLKYMIWAMARLGMGRSIRVSYAFTAEDRLIESILKPIITQPGFYVDVGCNEPRFISNTFLLYRRGWRGICIDANTRLIQKFQFIRPRDKAIVALINTEKKILEFNELENNVLSTADNAHLEEGLAIGQKIIKKHIITTQTLTEILDKYKAPTQFDLLSLDIEGYDLKALQSLDFRKYQPRLIVVEADDFDPENPQIHPIYTFLKNQKYTLIGSILTNLYFISSPR
jgi:FkbM family methyltransferase